MSYLFSYSNFYKHMLFLISFYASNMFQTGRDRNYKRLGMLWNAPKTSVPNILQRNRLTGNR